ncbi:MAG: HD domain-containing protein [Spirochaetales bacterium]|nr:HD domain-containing protein [Spirochaetales bacterium]
MKDAEMYTQLEELKSEREKIDISILNEQGTRHWINIYSQQPIPLIITDNALRIVWINKKFSNLFGDHNEYVGIRFDRLFFKNGKDTEKVNELNHNIKTQKASYYWQGKTEVKNADNLSMVVNVIILPIYKASSEISTPIAYACLFDNISEEYKEILKITFLSLLEASRLKDNDTGNHIARVNNYSKILAITLYGDPHYNEINHDFIEDIGFLAAMHDVGKIGTPDNILTKPDRLNPDERKILEEHTINGAYLLNTYPNPMAKEIALSHHEWWNGDGYPYGLVEEMIPLSARIVAIADTYDALRMKRPYKKSFSHDHAKNHIVEAKGTHFDPDLVVRFLRIEKEFDTIFEELKDE